MTRRYLCTLLCVVGCHATPQTTVPDPAETDAAAASSQPPDGMERLAGTEPTTSPVPEPQVEARAAPRAYELVWTHEIDGWTKDVVVTPSGDPLFLNGDQLTLLARHDGSELQRARVPCHAPNNAMAILDATTIVMGCGDGILEVGLPHLSFRRAYPTKGTRIGDRIETFAAHGDLVAYATETGKIVVLRREPPSYTSLFHIETHADVESMAIMPNHAWLIVGEGAAAQAQEGEEGGTLAVYDLASGKLLRRSNVQGRGRITAVSASPDSDHVFVHAGSFEASTWTPDTAAWGSAFEIGSWLTSSTWLTPTLVFGAGSDGAALFPLERGQTVPLEVPGVRHGAMAGAGASADGSYVCSGDREGNTACWSNQDVLPSTYEPPPPLAR